MERQHQNNSNKNCKTQRFSLAMNYVVLALLFVLMLLLYSMSSLAAESNREDINNREVVPLINAQLNDLGMQMFGIRAFNQFTLPNPIWDELGWKSINELKHEKDAWSKKEEGGEGYPAKAYTSCIAMQEESNRLGRPYRIVGDFVTPDNLPLYDNNDNPILYDVLLNQVAQRSISSYKPSSKNDKLIFPGQIQNTEPQIPSAIFLKFALKVLTAEEAENNSIENRFYQTKVFANLPGSGGCQLIDVALMGLHLTIKPMQSDKQGGFSWATYVHKDAVPDYKDLVGENKPDGRWVMFNEGNKVLEPQQFCAEINDYQQKCCNEGEAIEPADCGLLTKAIIEKQECKINKYSGQRESAQLVQLCPSSSMSLENDHLPWSNYKFIENQWEMGPTNKVIPTVLSNPMLEPFFDEFGDLHGVKVMGNASCISCHSQAKKTDMIFSISSLLGK